MVLITIKMAEKLYEGGNQFLSLDFQKERNLVISTKMSTDMDLSLIHI